MRECLKCRRKENTKEPRGVPVTQSRDKQSGTGPPKPVQAARLGAGSVPAPSQTGFHKHCIPKHAGRQTQRNPEQLAWARVPSQLRPRRDAISISFRSMQEGKHNATPRSPQNARPRQAKPLEQAKLRESGARSAPGEISDPYQRKRVGILLEYKGNA